MKNILFLLLNLLPIFGFSQEQPPLNLSGTETQSAIIIDVKTGAKLYSYNSDKRSTPASLTKLFTTAAALEMFGDEHRIATDVFFNASTKSMVIVGNGDPTLGSEHFTWHTVEAFSKKIAQALMSMGVSQVSEVLVDVGRFEGAAFPSKRMWEDMGNYYGAPPYAINVNDNSFVLRLDSPHKIGGECQIVSMSPRWGEMPQCRVKASSQNRDSAYIYGVPDGKWYVQGAIPAGRKNFEVKGALPNPPKVFAAMIKEQLNKDGIAVLSDVSIVRNVRLADYRRIVRLESPVVQAIVSHVNTYSNNLYADALLMQLSGSVVSWDNGVAALSRFCQKAIGLVPQFYDGSGLSPFNAVTSQQVVDLLRYMTKTENSRQFRVSLSIAGISGTLRNFGRGTSVDRNVIGKSGSMNGVLAYAGYATTQQERNIAFCIIVNHQSESNAVVRAEIVKWLSTMIETK